MIVAALEFPDSQNLKCKENEFSSELAEKRLRVSIASETMGDILHRLVRKPAKDDHTLSFLSKTCGKGERTSMPYIEIPTWIKQWWGLNPIQAGVAKLSFSSSEFDC